MNNPFADEDADFRFNACVGENGWPGIHTYIDGYHDAVLLIGKKILEDEHVSVDALIYPFCFSARHRIELSIKALVIQISEVVGRSEECSVILLKHDMKILWDKYVELSQGFDRRYADINAAIKDVIVDFFLVDPTGQTFRYPFSAEDNKRHLVDYSIINLEIVFEKYLKVAKWFDDVKYLTRDLSDEYRLGTRTSKLSRRDLFQIAGMLPKRKEWVLDVFDEVKGEIKSVFGVGGLPLSSNDFSRALDAIQGHRQLSALIGKEIAIKTIDCTSLAGFILKKRQAEMVAFHQYESAAQAKAEARSYMEGMADEAVATAHAFYSIGVEAGCYSEYFDAVYAEQLRSLKMHRHGHFNYILSKRYFVHGMLKGLQIMGQLSLLSCLERQGLYPLAPDPEASVDMDEAE